MRSFLPPLTWSLYSRQRRHNDLRSRSPFCLDSIRSLSNPFSSALPLHTSHWGSKLGLTTLPTLTVKDSFSFPRRTTLFSDFRTRTYKTQTLRVSHGWTSPVTVNLCTQSLGFLFRSHLYISTLNSDSSSVGFGTLSHFRGSSLNCVPSFLQVPTSDPCKVSSFEPFYPSSVFSPDVSSSLTFYLFRTFPLWGLGFISLVEVFLLQ